MRLKALLFKNTYNEEKRNISKQIEEFSAFYDFFEKELSFKRFIEYVLHIGNYLNGKNSKGNAGGFKLDTLLKVAEFKSSNNKVPFLIVVIEQMSANDEVQCLESITKNLERAKNCLILKSEL